MVGERQQCNYPIDFVTLFQCFAPFAHALIGQSAFRLEPHALHLVQVLHGRYALLWMNNQLFINRQPMTNQVPSIASFFSFIR